MFNSHLKISYFILLASYLLISCSVSKQIGKSAKEEVLGNKALLAAHVGISIFDPAENKYLYNYQGDKYFVPASNTKIPTCYAAMKYLGDSLVGLRYLKSGDSIFVQTTADPTFLHPDFKMHPVFNFLYKKKEHVIVNLVNWREERFGSGWSWNDYLQAYMTERSPMPVYGNIRKLTVNRISESSKSHMFAMPEYELKITPSYKERIEQIPHHLDFQYFDSAVLMNHLKSGKRIYYDIIREIGSNKLWYITSLEQHLTQHIPLNTQNFEFVKELLQDTCGLKISIDNFNLLKIYNYSPKYREFFTDKIHSQPTDSLLKPMMHRSDNFFAEQSLLMVSNEMLGVMNDAKIIDTLLKTDFKDLPQKPRWADGSGLSRYNLFTPQDFVAILNKMKNEFGMERIKVIFPTGGEGTISSYYKADSGYIYAKTGTLSGVVAFSGYLYTKKGKLLIFSTLINNHQSSANDIRKVIEKFLTGIRSRF